MSAMPLALTVIVGRVAPPAVIGALHTLSSVLSEALKCVSSVYVFPAESVTADALALPLLQIPASTINRLPLVMFAAGCNARLPAKVRFEVRCTNATAAGLPCVGVTASDAADSALVPTA